MIANALFLSACWISPGGQSTRTRTSIHLKLGSSFYQNEVLLLTASNSLKLWLFLVLTCPQPQVTLTLSFSSFVSLIVILSFNDLCHCPGSDLYHFSSGQLQNLLSDLPLTFLFQIQSPLWLSHIKLPVTSHEWCPSCGFSLFTLWSTYLSLFTVQNPLHSDTHFSSFVLTTSHPIPFIPAKLFLLLEPILCLSSSTP